MSGLKAARTMARPAAPEPRTMAHARRGVRRPAAMGKNGLFITSISTSYIWLMPTMKRLPSSSANTPSSARGRSAGTMLRYTGDSMRARPTPVKHASSVPRIVCGRLKR